ncbi:hypothetical protein ccbrp13_56630 [Ktedonobacteria bacterium brp13]|nr:hypothetical protein ccbrp13_56630 [Ktedonobacteria bacterium brp13]
MIPLFVSTNTIKNSSRRCIQLTPLALEALHRHASQQRQQQTEHEKSWNKERWIFCNELLGHNSILVTLEIYSHILPPLQEDTMQKFHTWLTANNPLSGQ